MTAPLDYPASSAAASHRAGRSHTAPLRLALRIAWRDLRRAPGRALLVIALIALPVFALSAADVVVRTMALSPSEQLARDIGGAQAILTMSDGAVPILQNLDGSETSAPNENAPAPRPLSVEQILARLPPGSSLTAIHRVDTKISTAFGLTEAQFIDRNYSDPVFAPLYRNSAGRVPAAGNEVALSSALARSTGWHIGSTFIDLQSKRTYTVVGLVDDRFHPGFEQVFAAPGALGTAGWGSPHGASSYYVSSPSPVTWPLVLGLNQYGIAVTSRYAVAHPPPRSQMPFYVANGDHASSSAAGVTAGVVLASMLVLEIALLAGPAFTVGARRIRHTLGLLGAAGASRADLRNVVLAGGAVLGFLAGVAGLITGVGAGLAVLPLVAGGKREVPGHLDFRALELGGIAAASVVTGLAAAWLPARSAARTDIVAALRGRRGTVRTNRLVPVVGLVMISAGLLLTLGSAIAQRNFTILLIGALVVELGLISCTSALVSGIGRGARWLPLAGRIALRDTVRNRSASTSAVAAIMAAVTGGVAASVLVASMNARDRSTYYQAIPQHYGWVPMSDQKSTATTMSIVRSSLVDATVVVIRATDERAATVGKTTVAIAATVPVAVYGGVIIPFPKTLVDDGTAMDVIAGRSVPDAVSALKAGKAVVFDQRALHAGKLRLRVLTTASNGSEVDRTVEVPAVDVSSSANHAGAVLPPSMVKALGGRSELSGVLIANARPLSAAAVQSLQLALSRADVGSSVYLERGYQQQYNVALSALLGASALIALAAALISTLLAGVDSKSDLETLAAIGASPRVRRRLSAARAGVVAAIGCTLGVACGFVAPVGFLGIRNAVAHRNHDVPYPLAVPWPAVLLCLLLLPAVAALGGLAFSRSSLPAERARAN